MSYGHVVISSNMKDWDAKLIKWFTGSYFSHSFFTAEICGRLVALEAASSGTSVVPFDLAYENNNDADYIMYELNVPQDVKDQAILLSMNDLEKGYGYLELPWFIWRRICLWFGKDIRHKDNWSQAGIICSEFTSNYEKYCKLIELFEGFGKGSINAQDIYEICKAQPEYFTEVKRKIRSPNDPRL